MIDYNEGTNQRRKNSKIVKSLQEGKITLEDFLITSQMNEYKALKSVKVYKLLGSMRGWSEPQAFVALNDYNINPNITIRSVLSRPRVKMMVQLLFNNPPKDEHSRIRPSKDYPWRGNVFSFLSEFPIELIPEEIKNIANYLSDDENREKKTNTIKEESLWPGAQTVDIEEDDNDDIDDDILSILESSGDEKEDDLLDDDDDDIDWSMLD